MSPFSRRPSTPPDLPENDPAARAIGRRQNANGDVVVSAAIGEVVLLPRLWDFRLMSDDDGRLELRSDSGLVAEVVCRSDGTAELSAVAPVSSMAPLLLERPAS